MAKARVEMVDGKNIMTLIATMFMVLIPDFVKEGRLCWLKAPLYRLGRNGQRVYAYNDEELATLQGEHPNWELGRFKGLGEMAPDDVENSMFNEENQRLEVLKIDDFDRAFETLNMLMGKEVSARRDYLFVNVDFRI